MKTEAAMSSNQQAEIENNLEVPETPKRWKSRLQRFQSSLRRSMRIKKGYSLRSGSLVDGERRDDLTNGSQNYVVKRSDKHVKREIMADKVHHNSVSTKQVNGTKTSSHSHYLQEKTSLDNYSFDKRKSERNKTLTNGNNNDQNDRKNSAGSPSSPAHVSNVAGCGEGKSNLQKKSQRSKRKRANTNIERTSLKKSKSLSILTNLFKRSSHSKDKDNRGKSPSFGTAQTKGLSTTTSTDFDNLATDIVVSSSSIDSCGDNEPRSNSSKYYSLKRSKKKLVFPNNNITRSFSLDDTLDPQTDPLMEKSRTLAAIPPCIRVEEYRENRGCFERSLSVEFSPGSSGSVTIETGPDYYQHLTGCSPAPCKEAVRDSHSSGTRKNGVERETGLNITHEAERTSDAWKRHSAPPISSCSTDKNSSNIGSAILRELKTDIGTCEESRGHFEHNSDAVQSNFSEQRNLVTENVHCPECLKSDMGNNLSYAMQKQRKFNPKDTKLKSAILRSIKKNGKTFHEKTFDGEEDPIIEQTDFLDSYERELENGGLNYPPNDVSAYNEVTKDKSSSLYEGTEALGMIDTFHGGNNYAQDSSDVKTTVSDSAGENQAKENWTTEGKCACENTERLSNGNVNTAQEVCQEHFCSSTFGQTRNNDSLQQGDCLSCRKTRSELTDFESNRCSPVFDFPASRTINTGVLNESKLRERSSKELITSGLREICNGGPGLAKNLKVNSLPNSPKQLSLPTSAMHSSFPDIRKLHALHLSPKLSAGDSSDSLSSSCSFHMENEFNDNASFEDSGQKISPLCNGFTNCKRHGGFINSHLSPELREDRQRSCSARVPHRSPVQQVLQSESRSVSCSQLDKNANDIPINTSPPYVRPRIQSLEELPPNTAEVILRKKRSIIRKARMNHTASLPFVDNVFNDIIDKGKRHSYGGYGDITFLQLPHLLQRSQSAEGQLDSCNSSLQSIHSSSSITENELGSTFSVGSELTSPDAFDKSFCRSRSMPGFFGADIHQSSPIPEERSSVSEMEGTCPSGENSDDDGDDVYDDVDGEMDVPEAFAEALWDHVTMDPEELSFQAGDIITVLTMTSCDWWFGQVGDRVGWFPAPFVRVRVSQTLAADETKLAPPVRTRKGTNEGFLSDAVVRSRVVLEVLSTERDYVKNLEDVVEGYLKQARKRTDMFTEEQISKIFSNIEQIYLFHQDILRQLEECFIEEDPRASEIGSVFLNNKNGFDIYSEYCNNHPHAMAELKTLCESNKYKQFFEACRLLQDMISISLDGFLLTPVQKICKYPLQLAELKKHTRPSHKDFQTVKQALEAMKNVASLINERKRKVESINKIAKWQSTIEGWEGEDVLERSSELIHSGDVVKTSNGSSQDRVMFLFDHQLVYCKKDILKKNGLTYKGRIDMDDCTVIWLRDGEENLDRSPLHNAWKIYNFKKEKWYIFYTKKAAGKEKWMKAFKDERRRVREDAKTGLIISQNTRKAAMRAAKASVKHKKVNGKKEKPFQKSQSTTEIKPPPSPTLRLPDPVSSADFKEEDEERDTFGRSSVIRRSFGLRGSKKSKDKEKRMSSIF